MPLFIIRQRGTLSKVKGRAPMRKEARHEITTDQIQNGAGVLSFRYGFIGAGVAGAVGGGWIGFWVAGRGLGLGGG